MWQIPERLLRLSPDKKHKVFITTATKGLVRAEMMNWLLQSPWLRFAPNVVPDCKPNPKPLEDDRNRQVWRFLDTDCTHFFILDSDCRPRDGTVKRLTDLNVPIVSAPHPTAKPGPNGMEIALMVLDRTKEEAVYRSHQPLRGLQGPDVVVGCAGMMIQRHVFETMKPPWFEFIYDERGLLKTGEDFQFCEKAHELGFPVWADCDWRQWHWMELMF